MVSRPGLCGAGGGRSGQEDVGERESCWPRHWVELVSLWRGRYSHNMQKRTPTAKLTGRKKGKKRKSSASRRPAPELSPMDKLEASVQASQEERRRNPPKTDYVLEDGRLKSVPAKLLATEKDVLGMYDHLHEFCASSVAPYFFLHRAHAHPIDCLQMMYRCSCISLKEMKDILRMPVQIRLLHERLFRQELLGKYPYQKFIVEFVGLLQFIIRLHGFIVPKNQQPRRYCYCWHTYEVPAGKPPFPRDLIADSYELRLTADKKFLGEWKTLRDSVPVAKWAYCIYQDWLLAFDNQGSYDQQLTESLQPGARKTDGESEYSPGSSDATEVKAVLHAFCEKWSLTHLGTPFEEDESEPTVMLRAERVEVMPKREKGSSFVNTLSPNGFEVRLPKYYGFDHMPRHLKEDFFQLKFAFDMVKELRQRKTISEMSTNQKKYRLRSLRKVLAQNRVAKDDAYRILKGLVAPIADSTMKKLGFVAPQMHVKHRIRGGEVIPMKLDEAFAATMKAIAARADDQRVAQRIFSKFGIDVDFLMCGLNANKPK